jgi:hypothetical protein
MSNFGAIAVISYSVTSGHGYIDEAARMHMKLERKSQSMYFWRGPSLWYIASEIAALNRNLSGLFHGRGCHGGSEEWHNGLGDPVSCGVGQRIGIKARDVSPGKIPRLSREPLSPLSQIAPN